MRRLFVKVWFAGFLFLLPSAVWAWTPFFVNGFCQKSGKACYSSVGNSGGAGACCDPTSPDINTCLKDDPCTGTHQSKWDTNKFPLGWYMNANNMAGKSGFPTLTEAQVEAELKRGWNVWSGPACTVFQHKFLGRTTAVPDYYDGKITVYLATEAEWAQLGQATRGALAFSASRYNDAGQYVDGDVIVNPKPAGGNWGVKPVPANAYDFTAALAHEIGHSLGFGHTPLRSALMFFAIKGQGDTFTGLGTDDRDAICSTYPATNACKTSTECGPCFACTGGKCQTQSPPIALLCKPCQSDAGCGLNGVCAQTAGGNRCLQKCQGADCCPPGYRCEQQGNSRLCIPMVSQCPLVTCTTAAQCGRGGTCTNGRCVSTTPFDTKLCSTPCQNTIDCGGGALSCHVFPSGTRRCIAPCVADAFCPAGYSCQRLSTRNFCVPLSIEFCPCTTVAECAKGQTCKANLCQGPAGNPEGAPCHDKVPCQTGFRCVTTRTGRKCLRDCLKTPCPAGRGCSPAGINRKFCVGLPSQAAGKDCDGVILRCQDGLTCVQHKNTADKGICVKACKLDTDCSNGEVCTNSDTGVSYCGCRDGGDCSVQKLPCKDRGNGFSMCFCESPPCAAVCGNGTCEPAALETCTSCKADCACDAGELCQSNACRPSQACGDGTCSADKNETCATCPQDCQCPAGESCQGQACKPPTKTCGDGTCDPALLEHCGSCPADCPCPSGQACSSTACKPVSVKECGNGVCSADKGETCTSCPQDCACTSGQACESGVCQASAACGNGTCDADKGESCTTCPKDCPCPAGFRCDANGCIEQTTPSTIGRCGDGVCTLSEGETCTNCPNDCGCKERKICTQGACVSADSLCPPEHQKFSCGANGTNCRLSCQQLTACGCQTPPSPSQPLPLLLLLVGLFIVRRVS